MTVGSWSTLTAIKWPNSVLVWSRRRRTLVAFVQSCSTGDDVKLLALGRPFTSDTAICNREATSDVNDARNSSQSVTHLWLTYSVNNSDVATCRCM